MTRKLSLFALFLTAACSSSELVVESNTSWSGHISGEAGYSLDGHGDRQIEVGGETTCWSFQKGTEDGYLRAYMNESTIFGTDKVGAAETSAAYGVVSGCSSAS